ncbi:MAG: YceH family protein [Dokdonella sp.]|nr:YceH family protein [Dokdonella sp.]
MESDASVDNAAAAPPLDPIEARILGCLIEKAATTPEVYPLTVNALVAACNQKTSREPVMHLEVGTVAHTLRVLEGKGLVKVAPSSQRALRYEHRFESRWNVTARQRAVLCVMLLRGPQTPAELLTRCDRLADFHSLDAVRDTLEHLLQRDEPLVTSLPLAQGQREIRYMHLLGGPLDLEALVAAAPPLRESAAGGLSERVAELEAEIASLRSEVEALRQRLDAVGA